MYIHIYIYLHIYPCLVSLAMVTELFLAYFEKSAIIHEGVVEIVWRIVLLYKYTYICVTIFVYIYIYIYIYAYVHMYMYMHIYTSIHTHTYMYLHKTIQREGAHMQRRQGKGRGGCIQPFNTRTYSEH